MDELPEIFFNAGETSGGQQAEGMPSRVLTATANHLKSVSSKSKQIKKRKQQLRMDKEIAKELQVEEWENANAELLTSGIPTVYVDGACKQNSLFREARKKGREVTEEERQKVKASFGIYWGDDHRLNLSMRLSYKKQTNNRAELAAAVEAMKQAVENNIPNLIIFTDSEYVVNIFNKWIDIWKQNNWQRITDEGPKKISNLDYVHEMDKLRQQVNAHIVYVYGHIGVPGNQKAHELAQAAIKMDLQQEHPDVWRERA